MFSSSRWKDLQGMEIKIFVFKLFVLGGCSKRASLVLDEKVGELRAELAAIGQRSKELTITQVHPPHLQEKLAQCLVSSYLLI